MLVQCRHCGKKHQTLSGLAQCLRDWKPARGVFGQIYASEVPIPVPFPERACLVTCGKDWEAVNFDVYDLVVQKTVCFAVLQQRNSSGRQGKGIFELHKKYYLVMFDPFQRSIKQKFVEIPSARIARQGVARTLKYFREQKNSQERLARAIALRVARAKGKAMLAELPGAKLRKTQLTLPGGQVVDLLKGGLK